MACRNWDYLKHIWMSKTKFPNPTVITKMAHEVLTNLVKTSCWFLDPLLLQQNDQKRPTAGPKKNILSQLKLSKTHLDTQHEISKAHNHHQNGPRSPHHLGEDFVLVFGPSTFTAKAAHRGTRERLFVANEII